MLTNLQKKEIAAALLTERDRLGSWKKVEVKTGANVATISHNMQKPELWHLVSPNMWARVAASIGVKLGASGWAVVNTTNTQLVTNLLRDAQGEAMFMGLSEKAGSGKTASIQHYRDADTTGSVFVLQCEEWHKRPFLIRLCESLGVATTRTLNIDQLTGLVVDFFKQKARSVQPLLILDEADKLRPAALRFLIPLFNRLEDQLGVVIAGTEYLRRNIQAGVQRGLKGYDEIDSRLGRSYSQLIGATRTDVNSICVANALTDPDAIGRVWAESLPRDRHVGGRAVAVVDDLRRVKRLIKRERLLLAQ